MEAANPSIPSERLKAFTMKKKARKVKITDSKYDNASTPMIPSKEVSLTFAKNITIPNAIN